MKLKLVLVLTAALSMAAAGTAQAAVTVSNANDSGPGSLRQAIESAPPGETVIVPAGDYQVSSEPLKIEKSVTVTGAGPNATVIRSTGPFRVFTIMPAPMTQAAVTLSQMMIRDGRVFELQAIGAGVLAVNANLTLSGVNLTGNLANANEEGAGGVGGTAVGAGAFLTNGQLTVSASNVYGNTAEARGGPGAHGGMAEGGGVFVANSPYRVEGSSITGNVSDASGGPGATDGGLAAGAGVASNGSTEASTLASSTIAENVAQAMPGPSGNAGEVGGAGLFAIAAKSSVSLANSTIAANVARNGAGTGKPGFAAGLFAVAGAGGTVTITSTTIAANRLESTTPESQGGNLFAVGPPGSISFANSIVSAGVGPAGSENCVTTESKSLGFNLDSLDQCGFHAPGDQVNTDPALLPLQSFGGPTLTMAPTAGSPIIDQGASFGLSTDQTGAQRPVDFPTIPNSPAPGADGSDIGAFELQPSSQLALGKLKRNRRKGTATLSIRLGQPSLGTLGLRGKGLKGRTVTIAGQSEVKLKVALASRKLRKALRRKGRRKVGIRVTYSPTANAAVTVTRKAKLIQKAHRKRKKSRTHKRH